MTRDANGNLFGTTFFGRTNRTIWELAKGSGTITTLALFNATVGGSPLGGVTLDAGGNLYGTASQGGASNFGTSVED